MTERMKHKLVNPQQAHQVMRLVWQHVKGCLQAGVVLQIEVKKLTRSLEQNALMWSCLTDLSNQVVWGGDKKFTPEGWKDFITAHLHGQEMVENMDGTGYVWIGKGRATSDMTIKEMIDVITLCHAFGNDRGVKWSKTSIGRV